MKKYLLLFTTLLLTLRASYGQTKVYHPFAESNATWEVEFSSIMCCPVTQVSSWSQYKVTGADTLIGAKTYKKIFHGSTYVGGYRQDIPNKKIYCTARDPIFGGPGVTTPEYLLYDFALSVGDIFKSRPLTGCDTPCVVTSIDSVLIGNNYRKKINLKSVGSLSPISIIEGIGSEAGLLGHGCFEHGVSLCNYKDNSITFINKSCNNTTHVREDPSFKQINIHPNPFSSQTVLQTENPFNHATLLVDNYLGQTIKQIKNISGQAITLDRDNLPSGVYFIRLIQDNQVIVTEKLVITDN